ncbi:recombinase family protein [Clostridium tertium]|uniref:recombinase family protein n=1 Tax=Clostridium tertium TaxID=1559 RepID=UPI002330B7EE|nr:recombinase family protein [Clostridium tertium]MDB1955457.1 recombinase family protein [Clostridium tertium]MDB1957232.1 recombinase family protein [Clostridium tertium]MDB1961822.1 recombinase family protein [Clostridium tertium]MDB1966748.1 recombinase family protein [Clostridium tertium]
MNTSKNFFYGRVSSDQQSLARQLNALKIFTENNPHIIVDERDIFLDKKSGKDFINRTEYNTLKRILRPKDLLIICSLDRLSRNYSEVVQEWRDLTNKGVDILVLDMPLLDTRQNKDLLGNFISNLVIEILGYVSEQERLSIRQRQLMGIEAAKKRNIKFGAPKIEVDFNSHQFQTLYSSWKNGEIKTKYFMNSLGLKSNSFYRRIKDYETQLKNKST